MDLDYAEIWSDQDLYNKHIQVKSSTSNSGVSGYDTKWDVNGRRKQGVVHPCLLSPIFKSRFFENASGVTGMNSSQRVASTRQCRGSRLVWAIIFVSGRRAIGCQQ